MISVKNATKELLDDTTLTQLIRLIRFKSAKSGHFAALKNHQNLHNIDSRPIVRRKGDAINMHSMCTEFDLLFCVCPFLLSKIHISFSFRIQFLLILCIAFAYHTVGALPSSFLLPWYYYYSTVLLVQQRICHREM